MEWISIETKEPEMGKEVLVYIIHPVHGIYGGRTEWRYFPYIAVAKKCCQSRHVSKWIVSGYPEFAWPDRVACWQDLPEHPKKSDE